MRQGVGSGRGPRRSERGTAAKRGPHPIRGLMETSADGWRLLVEYEPDRYEATSAYALFHF